ncbi:hypothetical protein [Gloeocapsa sp. PCC 73106]|uniref:hypothetical protein n=1 Tax=Gloeocapsa sp. PCC 73106 TaxID=102232 RepID=UPI0002AC6069|nr:hypothetical protein [Gloeocapsa sp. PCC 73106]ELR99688.1 hypothetical protein GLO73106DRAFT_00035400 [Gloeocapsa sp. PCC 73106]
MASTTEVKQYLAYWFQLGKGVVVGNSEKTLLPNRVYEGDRYSREFETCWQQISTLNPAETHLEGTNQSIEQLLSPQWDINSCARCEMPVPAIVVGLTNPGCPCDDLDSWPNSELPSPRSAVSNQKHLNNLTQRLEAKESEA